VRGRTQAHTHAHTQTHTEHHMSSYITDQRQTVAQIPHDWKGAESRDEIAD